jgi:acetyl-CoA carboxylase carboxyltransferase component
MDKIRNKNEDHNKKLVSLLDDQYQKTALGGGLNKIHQQHEKGKLTARERIEYLLDKNSRSI